MNYSMRFRADELWVSTKRGVYRRRKVPVIKRWLKARDAGRFVPLLFNSIMQSTLFIVYISS
jgi:frataxin-like iron-binding protein CyaY